MYLWTYVVPLWAAYIIKGQIIQFGGSKHLLTTIFDSQRNKIGSNPNGFLWMRCLWNWLDQDSDLGSKSSSFLVWFLVILIIVVAVDIFNGETI